MSFSKTFLFEENLQQEAKYFKALSHPVRIQILLYFAGTRSCLKGDLSALFPLARTTLNQHISTLRASGLIKAREIGGKTVYCLNPGKVKQMRQFLDDFSKKISLPDGFSCEYKSVKVDLPEKD